MPRKTIAELEARIDFLDQQICKQESELVDAQHEVARKDETIRELQLALQDTVPSSVMQQLADTTDQLAALHLMYDEMTKKYWEARTTYEVKSRPFYARWYDAIFGI